MLFYRGLVITEQSLCTLNRFPNNSKGYVQAWPVHNCDAEMIRYPRDNRVAQYNNASTVPKWLAIVSKILNVLSLHRTGFPKNTFLLNTAEVSETSFQHH